VASFAKSLKYSDMVRNSSLCASLLSYTGNILKEKLLWLSANVSSTVVLAGGQYNEVVNALR